jgi:hypothetical protein
VEDVEDVDAPVRKRKSEPIGEEIIQEFDRIPGANCEVNPEDKCYSAKPGDLDDETLLIAVLRDVVKDFDRKEKPETLTEKDIPRLREQWYTSCYDIMHGVPEKLPPLREVNHKINLIDDNMQYRYHYPKCPDALRLQLITKIEQYKRAGWWEERTAAQAAPMLCIPKKDGKTLQTAIDCRKRNDNTIKDVTPFPDQDLIRLDVARAKIRSKIDFSDAYEQVRVEPADVHKTAFATIFNTMVSHTMQIGDCNAPATFQRVMTLIF